MKIEKDKVVSLHYTLTNSDGEVLDSSDGKEPMAYIHGNGHLIKGLEEDLEGKEAGYKNDVQIPPNKGYGEKDDSLIQTLPIADFGDDEVKPGMQFKVDGNHGVQIATVIEVAGKQVTVDGNHELAGVTLNFKVEIVDVRDATAEELSHGHVHGPGGHHSEQ